MNEDFAEHLKEMMEEAKKYETCMALSVHEESMAVELLLDTGVATYSKWLEGERSDVALRLCHKTNRVVGIRLPLLKDNLVVHHLGPIRINSGFRKTNQQ